MSKITHIDENLKTLLQRDIQFVVKDKVLREGKLMVFNIKDFYISFIIYTKKGQTKTYDIPLPYQILTRPDNIILDYTLKNVHYGKDSMQQLIESISKSVGKKSKLYDTHLTIKYSS
jgi:hypothetical protein